MNESMRSTSEAQTFQFLDADGIGLLMVVRHDSEGVPVGLVREPLAVAISIQTPDELFAYPERSTDTTLIEGLAQLFYRASRHERLGANLPVFADGSAGLLVVLSDFRQPSGFVGVTFQGTRNPQDPTSDHEYDQVTISVTAEDLARASDQILNLVQDKANRERFTAYIEAGGEEGQWVSLAHESKGACDVCKKSKSKLRQMGSKLGGRAFKDSQTYQADYLQRCESCGTFWLQQYWEIFDDDHQYEEFGERFEVWTELSADDLSLIVTALETGKLLTHEHFLK